MKKFIILALLATVGCVPTKSEKVGLPDDRDDAAADTRSLAAERMATMIAAQEKHVVKLSDDVLSPVALARSADALKEIEKVKEMKEAFGKALTTVHVLEEATLFLDRELRHSEGAYQAGVVCYEQRSKDFKDEKLRATCSSFATHYATLRDTVPAQRQRLAELRGELPAVLDTMRQSGQILDDYYLFVVNNPNLAKSPTLTRSYVQAIKNYVKRFESFESTLAKYRKGG